MSCNYNLTSPTKSRATPRAGSPRQDGAHAGHATRTDHEVVAADVRSCETMVMQGFRLASCKPQSCGDLLPGHIASDAMRAFGHGHLTGVGNASKGPAPPRSRLADGRVTLRCRQSQPMRPGGGRGRRGRHPHGGTVRHKGIDACVWAIFLEKDQYRLAPKTLITSARWSVDEAFYRVFLEHLNGEVAGGRDLVTGAADNASAPPGPTIRSPGRSVRQSLASSTPSRRPTPSCPYGGGPRRPRLIVVALGCLRRSTP